MILFFHWTLFYIILGRTCRSVTLVITDALHQTCEWWAAGNIKAILRRSSFRTCRYRPIKRVWCIWYIMNIVCTVHGVCLALLMQLWHWSGCPAASEGDKDYYIVFKYISSAHKSFTLNSDSVWHCHDIYVTSHNFPISAYGFVPLN